MGEAFHTIRCCGRTFTDKEWGDYCRLTREYPEERILTTFGKYTFNESDICVNPEREQICLVKGSLGYYCELGYAECGNGLWSFGINYCCGNGGGGYGVAWADQDTGDGWRRGYHSKEECLVAACDEAMSRIESCANHRQGRDKKADALLKKVLEFKKGLSRPKIVQLELFEL